ncbi:hypothetical protein C8R44DRAFT_734841 [Mycena epipterygia]|nr:hypothetical protein C8R44DRAFT_734841 [Mycena epipterygia]
MSHRTLKLETPQMERNKPPSAEAGTSSWEFPAELEREIFEITALLYLGTIPRFLRVARREKPKFYGLLYRHTETHIDDIDSCYIVYIVYICLCAAMLSRIAAKGADFFSNAIRNMEIWSFEWRFLRERSENVWSDKDLDTIFHVCTCVEHLLLISDLAKPPLLQILAATDCISHLALGELHHNHNKHNDFIHEFGITAHHLLTPHAINLY